MARSKNTPAGETNANKHAIAKVENWNRKQANNTSM